MSIHTRCQCIIRSEKAAILCPIQPGCNASLATRLAVLWPFAPALFLGVDPTRGLTELPFALTEPSNRIVTGCPSNEEANFVSSGRGGLPEDPRQVLRGQVIIQDFRTSTLDFRGDGETRVTNAQPPIVEAQGWIFNEQGKIELVASLHPTAKSI